MSNEMLSVIQETWRSFWSLPLIWQKLVAGGIAVFVFMLIFAWQFTIPLMLLAILVALCFRYSRGEDEL